ncbi:MAG: cupin domain-containing protein [Planctomycetia bacterium]|nr:cupin domain-containing protein [Planctomycetia bacterium]
MSQYFIDKSACRQLTPFPGVEMYASTGETMTVSLVEMAPGAIIPVHQHPHEQVGMIISGSAEFTIGGEIKRVGPGDRYQIPGNVPHAITALDERVSALDVFYPIREEYQ